MKVFSCQQCGQAVLFENTHCEKCMSPLGFLPSELTISALKSVDNTWYAMADKSIPAKRLYYCENHQHHVCNWMVEEGGSSFCMACDLNRHIPHLGKIEERQAWQQLEFAKHRLVYSLLRLGLPLESKHDEPEKGLSFDFISENNVVPEDANAMTGHALGQVTINASEANDADREQMREDMNESYRTVIGHFRHEIGHYYWDQLIAKDDQTLADCRALFGDDNLDYAKALEAHYKEPNADWTNSFISVYASSHPWEDWAETWAHYLHIVDTLETASDLGMSFQPIGPNRQSLTTMVNIDPYHHDDFEEILAQYMPLTFAVNNLNRGMGQPDLYPFVLVPAVRTKLAFIHQLLQARLK
ncbi:zinc-binding metallopeptidase family protein [Marinomonas colpomeniae]|uniref:Zinc-binding peptidase n=1 Tax=Marinomonas colpomeniae TaxID=2774408 RepID=A0ABR8NU09_9GAMM|nr:putative zinc-binding metallopeptidase [Marinomonas colpomeniae]MBD5769538.1 putative zinc-binding peptidase [Marinomonas colpomeniae]